MKKKTCNNRQTLYRCHASAESSSAVVENSLFDLIGKTEPDLTKSLGYVLARSPIALKGFLKLVVGEHRANALMACDCVVDCELWTDSGRADLAIRFPALQEAIVVEAKSPRIHVDTREVVDQARRYAERMAIGKCTIVALANCREYGGAVDEANVFSRQWTDVVELFDSIVRNQPSHESTLENDYLNYLCKTKGLMKYYDIEVLSIPAVKTIKGVEGAGIYECPTEGRRFRRIGEHKPLFMAFRGRGGSVKKLYKIKEIVSMPIAGPMYETARETIPHGYVERIEQYKQILNYGIDIAQDDAEVPKWVFFIDFAHSITLPHEIRYERNNTFVETERLLSDYFGQPNEHGKVVFSKHS